MYIPIEESPVMEKVSPRSKKTCVENETGDEAASIVVKGKRKRRSQPRDAPPQRSSMHRGVTRHRWTGRYEAHLWDKNSWNETQTKKGRQVYLVKMGSDREERRKRIMERGSDRLALITGQLHTPSPSSSSSSSSHNRTYSESFMPQTKSDQPLFQASPSLKYQFKEEVKEIEEPKLSTNVHKPIKSESTKPKHESTEPKETRPIQSQSQQPKSSFSSKKLNASIINSERTRSLSSLTIAAFVVFFPRLNIMTSNTILALRPLWLLLLTDCAIIMSHLMEVPGEGLNHEMEEDGKGNKDGSNGENWSDAEKLLERGLVVYQALRGMFIDCSLYMVVVICL